MLSMRSLVLTAILIASLRLVAHCSTIVLSNDDGWAEINIRRFYATLAAAGHDVVVSAPALDKSGTCAHTLRNLF